MKNPNQKRLLLADNRPEYRHSLRGFLELENYDVIEATSPVEAKEKLGNPGIDLALVDLRLTDDDDTADISGLEVAKLAAKLHIPCIIITAFDSVEVTRLALRSRGAEPIADDLIPKIYGPQAVLDAIKLVLNNSIETPEKSTFDNLKIDLEQKLVWKKGKLLGLSRYQYTLIEYLHKCNGAVCSPEQLLKEIYKEDVPAEKAMIDRRLERLVERLREKIEDNPFKPLYLVKVHGRGYRLVLEN